MNRPVALLDYDDTEYEIYPLRKTDGPTTMAILSLDDQVLGLLRDDNGFLTASAMVDAAFDYLNTL